jgi:hypothetical protein
MIHEPNIARLGKHSCCKSGNLTRLAIVKAIQIAVKANFIVFIIASVSKALVGELKKELFFFYNG